MQPSRPSLLGNNASLDVGGRHLPFTANGDLEDIALDEHGEKSIACIELAPEEYLIEVKVQEMFEEVGSARLQRKNTK